MKICSKCGVGKPLDAFSKNGRGGKRGDCKTCVAEYMRKWRQWPVVKEHTRERKREYHQQPVVKERMRERRQQPEVKERSRQRDREYRRQPEVKERKRQRDRERRQQPEVKERNRQRDRKRRKTPTGRERRRISLIVWRALKNGRLKKTPCLICGATKNVQAHHPDYAHPLSIVWFCPKHHCALHADIRANPARYRKMFPRRKTKP